MSQNVTLSTMISPAQALALGALVSGGSITKAAKEAGVARETVSRWVHHDPVFLAELQNVRSELALQTRCALEALGMRAVAVLADAIFKSVDDRVKQADRVAVLPITVEPCPADQRSRRGESVTQIIERIRDIQSQPIPRSCRGHRQKV